MSEQKLRQTVAALENSRAQLDNLVRQREVVRNSIEEHLRAKETLLQYSKKKEDEEILVPVGAEILIHAKIGGQNKGIMNIGGGVLMEKEVPEIIENIDDRLKELNNVAGEMAKQVEGLSSAIEQLSKQAQLQYANLQENAAKTGQQDAE